MKIKAGVLLVLFLLSCCVELYADDLQWQMVGPTTTQQSQALSFKIVGPCDCPCTLGGECRCGADCDCRRAAAPSQAKPVVYAYKFPGLRCPACVQLKQVEPKLPVRLVWRDAPQWVHSAPTLHWQAADGRWLKFVFGVHGDRAAFVRQWQLTTGASLGETAGL